MKNLTYTYQAECGLAYPSVFLPVIARNEAI